MKKVEIMLNINEDPASVIISKLQRSIYLHRAFICVFVMESLLQILSAFYFYINWTDHEKWQIACLATLIVNNMLLFFVLSISLFYFVKMGQNFVRYIITNDTSMSY